MKYPGLTLIAFLALLAVPCVRVTAAAAELPAGLARCADERNDDVRLRCFDHEISVWRAEAAPAPQKRNAEPAGEPFPLRREGSEKAAPGPTVQAHLTGVSTLADDRLSFQLDNGQVWVQNESRSGFPSSVGDPVTIKKGALGSIWLMTDKRWGTRVRRVR